MALYAVLLLLLNAYTCFASFLRTYPRPEKPAIHALRAGKACNGPEDPGYIKSSLKTQAVASRYQSIAARDGTEPISEYEAGIVYTMDIDIGTPKQTITVIADTGSWELYINPNCARAADVTFCTESGHFNPAASSTAKNLSSRYYVTFGTGGFVGDYFSDTLWFGEDYWPVTNLQFGVSDDSDYLWAGVLGLGYGERFNTNYPTLLDLLVSEGYINVPIFSLTVGSQGSSDAEIIVGGIDSHKYVGWLEPLELFPQPETEQALGIHPQYWVNMTSFGYTTPAGSTTTLTASGFSRTVMIDSGSTYSYIDADLVAAIAKQFGATVDGSGVYYVSCSYLNVDGYVNFGFNNGNMVINAKYSDFIVDFGTTCALGVQAADVGVNTWVLGTTFIRSAYLVFDQLYDAIWLANYEPCGGSLVTDLTEDAGNQLWTELYGGC